MPPDRQSKSPPADPPGQEEGGGCEGEVSWGVKDVLVVGEGGGEIFLSSSSAPHWLTRGWGAREGEKRRRANEWREPVWTDAEFSATSGTRSLSFVPIRAKFCSIQQLLSIYGQSSICPQGACKGRRASSFQSADPTITPSFLEGSERCSKHRISTPAKVKQVRKSFGSFQVFFEESSNP